MENKQFLRKRASGFSQIVCFLFGLNAFLLSKGQQSKKIVENFDVVFSEILYI